MTFKLSQQLDNIGNPNLPFELYKNYIEHNRKKFPQSVLDVINEERWSGGSRSEAPYYSDLESFLVENVNKSSPSARMVLSKSKYVEQEFKIQIDYEGLFGMDIPAQTDISHQTLTWRYDQFLFFDGYHSHGIKDKMFTHQIEWIDGNIWSVTARNINITWIN